MAGKRRRANSRSDGRYQDPGGLRLPASPIALLLADMWREGPELVAEPAGAKHVIFRWTREGVGEMAVRLPIDDIAGRELLRLARTDAHIGVELEAAVVTAVAVDGVEDGFSVGSVLELTLGPDSWHPERHSPHVRAGRDLLGCDWHVAMHSDAGATVLVDWRPLAVIEHGRSRHHCTISLYPPFKSALTAEETPVPSTIFLLRDPDHTNPEGNVPSLAHNARFRLAGARAPYAAAREYAATKGWWAGAGVRLQLSARQLIKLAGIDLNRVIKRGRASVWYDTLVRLLPSKARTAATASPVFDTKLGVEAPPPPVPARPGPARASPASA